MTMLTLMSMKQKKSNYDFFDFETMTEVFGEPFYNSSIMNNEESEDNTNVKRQPSISNLSTNSAYSSAAKSGVLGSSFIDQESNKDDDDDDDESVISNDHYFNPVFKYGNSFNIPKPQPQRLLSDISMFGQSVADSTVFDDGSIITNQFFDEMSVPDQIKRLDLMDPATFDVATVASSRTLLSNDDTVRTMETEATVINLRAFHGDLWKLMQQKHKKKKSNSTAVPNATNDDDGVEQDRYNKYRNLQTPKKKKHNSDSLTPSLQFIEDTTRQREYQREFSILDY